MTGIKPRFLLWLAAAMLMLISACSPLINHPGKRIAQPKLEKTHFVADDGTVLPLRSWLPENNQVKAVIIALHGFNDYSNCFTSTGNYLSRYGIACYAYDQRGFGSSPGRGIWAGIDAYTNDLTSFVKEIRKRYPQVPLYVLGESMGDL